MPKFVATTPIRHNGNAFAEGDIVELSAKEAAGLVASGALDVAPGRRQGAVPADKAEDADSGDAADSGDRAGD